MPVSALSAFSAIAGYFIVGRMASWPFFYLLFGVFFLACGSSALNEYQEADIDSLMERTSRRPVPAGEISKKCALLTALALIFLGFAILALQNFIALCLGVSAVILYNGIYTNLKKITPFAILPGALIGAIPPLIGGAIGGGKLSDPRLFIISLFLFIWQFPHFWLLTMAFDKEYERAGIPTFRKVFSQDQMRNITFAWMSAFVIASFSLSLFELFHSQAFGISFIPFGIWLVFLAGKLNNSMTFKAANLYLLLVLTVLSLGSIF